MKFIACLIVLMLFTASCTTPEAVGDADPVVNPICKGPKSARTWGCFSSSLRPYNSGSPFNTLIPGSPVLDTNNTAMAAWINAANPVSNAYDFSNWVYTADENTPRYQFECTEAFGVCELETTPNGVPIPPGAISAPGSDGHMAVWDRANGIAYEMWRYVGITAGIGQASWGGMISTTGNGVDDPSGDLDANNAPTGAEIALMSGVIRVGEIQRGFIDHALVIATSNSCSTATKTFRWPALKSDGTSVASNCIPEGARLQLDPSIDVDAIVGLTVVEKVVAKALQQYGAYNRDNSGTTPWFIVFEIAPEATGATCPGLGWVYCASGLTNQYQTLLDNVVTGDGVPLGRHMRVLATWNGT